MEPVRIDIYISNDGQVQRLAELGEDYYSMIETLNIEGGGLSDDSLIFLSRFADTDVIECEDLSYQYWDTVSDISIFSRKPTIDLIPYKKGALRFWSSYANQFKIVMFYCNHLSHLIAELEPPIDPKYYKFMDEKVLSKLVKIRNNHSYNDMEIICYQ